MIDGPTAVPTSDGHHVVVRGRRWRATDPSLPPEVSEMLRHELMAARRAVGAALRAADPVAERAARARVQRAKVALGERGTPWWEQSDADRRRRWEPVLRELASTDEGMERAVLALLARRAAGATICPSEVARSTGGETWRELMEPVRAAARRLAAAGRVEITQRGAPVDLDAVTGPIRIRLVDPE